MFYFDEKALGTREFGRKGSLVMNTLSIDKGFKTGGVAQIKYDYKNKKIVIKASKAEEDKGMPELTFITSRIGIYGGDALRSKFEIILCDDVFLINLVFGAFMLEYQGDIMEVSRGVEKGTLPMVHLDEIYWVDTENLTDLLKCQIEFAYKNRYMKSVVQDFMYYAEISGRSASTANNSSKRELSISSYSLPVDLSKGAAIDKGTAALQRVQQLEEVRLNRRGGLNAYSQHLPKSSASDKGAEGTDAAET